MEITTTFVPTDRASWRLWLEENHASARDIWFIFDERAEDPVPYLDAVEEALCFGWIDSIQKRHSPTTRAQRFSPRKPRSKWTELNRERCRRLIRLGLMTDAGRATLPDLDAPFELAPDIAEALRASKTTWANFMAFPELYRRVRVGYVEDGRGIADEFARRLANLVTKTAANTMFGNWDDGGRLG